MKSRVLFNLFLLLSLCGHAKLNTIEKSVYLPKGFYATGYEKADDYCMTIWDKETRRPTTQPADNKLSKGVLLFDSLVDERCRWSKQRSVQTKDVIVFFEPEFGLDPTKAQKASGGTFNINKIAESVQQYYDFYVGQMGMLSRDGKFSSKHKFMVMLLYNSGWAAYGGGYDDVIGAVWVNEHATSEGSKTLAHEIFHAMQFQTYCDGIDSGETGFRGNNGAFWERTANCGASQFPGYEILDQNDPARYLRNTWSHYMCEMKRYTTTYFLEHLRDSLGYEYMGKLWRGNTKYEHIMQTASKTLFDNDWSAMNDFIGLTAMKNVNWDYQTGTNAWSMKALTQKLSYNTNVTNNANMWDIIIKKPRTILKAIDYNNRHFAIRDCMAPQDWGYNIIQLFPEKLNSDGSADIIIKFKGRTFPKINYNAGWRWGVVAVSGTNTNNSKSRMSEVYKETNKTISFHINKGERAYLVVTGTPFKFASNHHYDWGAGFPKYHRYPYEIRLDNALPIGFEPNFEETAPRYPIVGGDFHINPDGSQGGWVAITAKVAPSVYVSPQAKVLNYAEVSDNVRIEDFATIKGKAIISDNAIIKENAIVFSNAIVSGNAVISGCAQVFNDAKISDDALVTDNAYVYQTQISGHAIACGNLWQNVGGIVELKGTIIAGGNAEAMSGSTGTYLQPKGAAGRKENDELGNLSELMIDSLKRNWDNLSIRKSILNSTHLSNSDICPEYQHFTLEEMGFDEIITSNKAIKATNDTPNLFTIDGSVYITECVVGEKIRVFNEIGELLYIISAQNGTNVISNLTSGKIYLIYIDNRYSGKITLP